MKINQNSYLMLKNYFKIAWRSLLKNKVTGFINIFGLAIGMGVALLIGLWLHDEFNFNKYHKNYDRLGQLMIHQSWSNKTVTSRAISLPTRPVLEEQFGSDFKHISLSSWNSEHLINFENNKILKKGLWVEPVFPEMFSLEFIAGNFETALKEPTSIVLNESIAKALFGDKNPIGKIVKLDATHDVKVTGVFKDFPKNTAFNDVEMLMPWELYRSSEDWIIRAESNWGDHSFQLFAQLAEKSNYEAVSTKIRDIEKAENGGANPEYFIFPMSQWRFYPRFENGVNTGGRIQFIWLFALIGIFVLVLACINFMNLSTARSEKRAKEVGIRKTIGSLRSQLIGQFLSESLLVAGIALMLCIVMVTASLNWFNEIADKALVMPYTNLMFWLAMIGFTIFTGLLAGSYPAFYLSSFEPLKVLKGTLRVGRWSQLPRQILVTTQFTVSILLIIGTIVVFQQIQHAKNRPVGYEPNSVIQFNSNQETYQKAEVIRNDLLKTGLIEEVAYSSSPITSVWSNTTSFSWEGKDEEEILSFGRVTCSFGFGKTVGWQIKEGRDFSKEYSTDTSALILNEAAVEQIGMDNIVGKQLEHNGKNYSVIGVVNNMIMESPWRPIKPTIFRIEPEAVNMHIVRFKDKVPVKDALATVETIFKKHSPSSPFDYEFVDEEYNKKFEIEERVGNLAYVFAFLAVLISCLGLFGLSAFIAERRTKEIGIRKVLGASLVNLWAMQSRGFIILILLSCLIASPLAWYVLDGWLSTYDYRIELGWGVFLFSGVLALLVTLVTVSFQSIKAALMSPARSLKDE